MPQLLGHPYCTDKGLGRQSARLGPYMALVFISSCVRKRKEKKPNPHQNKQTNPQPNTQKPSEQTTPSTPPLTHTLHKGLT